MRCPPAFPIVYHYRALSKAQVFDHDLRPHLDTSNMGAAMPRPNPPRISAATDIISTPAMIRRSKFIHISNTARLDDPDNALYNQK